MSLGLLRDALFVKLRHFLLNISLTTFYKIGHTIIFAECCAFEFVNLIGFSLLQNLVPQGLIEETHFGQYAQMSDARSIDLFLFILF